MKIKKGDTVIVLAGKDKGKKGTVEDVFPKTGKVLVSNVNMVKRHKKKRDERSSGGIIPVARPIHAGKVALVDPKKGVPTRVRYVVTVDGKDRVAVVSGQKV